MERETYNCQLCGETQTNTYPWFTTRDEKYCEGCYTVTNQGAYFEDEV